MQMLSLPHSNLTVSRLCLGTMTWGEQNTEDEAHSQLDYAISRGINFIDAAEMYPVPARPETQGSTERYLGTWLKRQDRSKLVIATKVVGPSRGLEWVRGGETPRLDARQIRMAVEASLKRLQTEYIDLYQLHWPARYVPMFGQVGYDPTQQRPSPDIETQLAALATLIEEGKIRYIGVSNETPWGVCQFTRIADSLQLPRIVTIQNAYSLLNRTFEMGLAETCHHEQVGLLAYSPMAFGLLSGKYLDNPQATGRLNQFPQFGGRYQKPYVQEATAAYVKLAREHGLSPAQMALAFVTSRWFVASNIIGATNLNQLAENINSASLQLSDPVLSEIEAIHQRHPNPVH
ncbi:aryl-alcohol dehydrogenase-like predicted oxidoreductase [Chitinivorax tropicus]|uniref:Protein tas n=1 Tax=Chitinivorax tropicus TaxID=714531 RepID=A0A840MVP1_9PROT|nr:NADP(H)-dependent aldo-keto reductase [Chitinivorax tropicus]MBB5019241.1 aryl-alcohol dehydrogenase-like predicted oxidoreductase [Chitinivorax tropicus]